MKIFKLFLLLVFFAELLAGAPALAGWHFSLQGSGSTTNNFTVTQNSQTALASVGIDLGSHFRIGGTYRRSYNSSDSYQGNRYTRNWDHIIESSQLIAHSVELTIVLYYGTVIVPYVQVGLVKKYTHVTTVFNGEVYDSGWKSNTIPVPNVGAGLNFVITKNFSIKASYQVSRALKLDKPPPNSTAVKQVNDEFISVGIGYNT